jgi:hypothetical protein
LVDTDLQRYVVSTANPFYRFPDHRSGIVSDIRYLSPVAEPGCLVVPEEEFTYFPDITVGRIGFGKDKTHDKN